MVNTLFVWIERMFDH